MNAFDRPSLTKEPRRPWVSPALKNVGTIGDIVQQAARSVVGGDGPTSYMSHGDH